LTTRIKGKKDPIKIIVDSDLCINPKARFMKNNNVILATAKSAKKTKIKEFESIGAKVIVAGESMVDLKALMKKLTNHGIRSILLEGGSELNASAIEAGIISKIYFFIAPKIIGGRNAKSPVGGAGIEKMKHALDLKNMKTRKSGNDILIEAEL
jgi:diaminohydroxyphosphoribosylaminopyrimidine deaminase/5-amino-6-(5-phosphoribosylamino)uracil reductase